MSAAIPVLILCAALALAGLGAAGAFAPPGRLQPFTAAAAGISAASLALLLLACIVPGAAAAALGAGSLRVLVDSLSLPPLLIVFFAALATLAAAWACAPVADRRTRLLLGPLAAAWALTLLAADGLTLMIGLLATATMSWTIAGQRSDQAAGLLATVLAGLACLLLAIDLLIGPGLSYAAIRAAPPTGWRAAAVLLASLAGVTLWAVRLTAWRPTPPRPPLLAMALVCAALPATASYLLLRLLLDMAGPAQPLAWGVAILLPGIPVALSGAVRATRATDLAGTLIAATRAECGLSLIAIGLVAMARAADQPELAAFALAGLLVALIAHAAFKCLLLVAAASLRHGAGTDSYGALGGTSRSMPVTTLCLVAGALSLASLPLSAGFVGAWTLLQSLFAASRLGGAAIQLLELAAALTVALTVGLLALATVRLLGIGLLGRPRTPRAAAAAEAPRALRVVLITLATLSLAVGVWPAAMFALAAPAVDALTGTPYDLAATWLTIAPAADASGYVPLGIFVLLAGVLAVVGLVRRALASPAPREAPVWAGGYAAPPSWLPFGEPALQYDAASFSAGSANAFAPVDYAQVGSALAALIPTAAHRQRPGLSRMHPIIVRAEAMRTAGVAAARRWRPVLRRYWLALALAALVLALFLLALALALLGAA